jgi:nucleoside 2-deoxyribosyltransferase
MPTVVCLCGSTRFYDAFQQANYDLTMRGQIVLSVGFYPHAKAEHGHGAGVGHDSAKKRRLDELHKRKIDLADYVLVLNVGGYIGDSTRSEIAYAHAHGKPVRYLTGTADRAPGTAPDETQNAAKETA